MEQCNRFGTKKSITKGGASAGRPNPRFEIIKNILYMTIILNLKKKHFLLVRICQFLGALPHGLPPVFTLDSLGASRQPSDPLANTAPPAVLKIHGSSVAVA
jgi:hypothetical protein